MVEQTSNWYWREQERARNEREFIDANWRDILTHATSLVLHELRQYTHIDEDDLEGIVRDEVDDAVYVAVGEFLNDETREYLTEDDWAELWTDTYSDVMAQWTA